MRQNTPLVVDYIFYLLTDVHVRGFRAVCPSAIDLLKISFTYKNVDCTFDCGYSAYSFVGDMGRVAVIM